MRLIDSISSPACLLCVKPIEFFDSIVGAGVGGHDDDHVAEIRLAAVVVGERAVVHHLQQDVEDVRVRLLDLVEQQHAVRMLGDRLGELPALVEADVARAARRSGATPRAAPCTRTCRSAAARRRDSRRAGARPRSCRRRSDPRTGNCRSACADCPGPSAPCGSPRPARRSPGSGRTRRSSSRDRGSSARCGRRTLTLLAGMRAILATISSISVLLMTFFCLRLRQDLLRRTGLVDHVDRLVGQMPVVDEARSELGRRRQRRRRVLHAVVLLEARSSGPSGSRSSRRSTARARRSSGSAATARGPSRRSRDTRCTSSRRCTSARRSTAPA